MNSEDIFHKVNELRQNAEDVLSKGQPEAAAGYLKAAIELADESDTPKEFGISALMVRYRTVLINLGQTAEASEVEAGIEALMTDEELKAAKQPEEGDYVELPKGNNREQQIFVNDFNDDSGAGRRAEDPFKAPGEGRADGTAAEVTPSNMRTPEEPITSTPRKSPPSSGTPELADTPLFFVPGILGSQLAKKVWRNGRELTVKPFWPPDLPLMTDRAGILSEMVNGLTSQSTVDAIGLFPGAYTPLIEGIKRLGYEINRNFFIFPYDWRKSNRVSGAAFAAEIRAKVAANPKWTKADVVCHSMGGFVTRMAHKLGAPIDRTIYIASPNYGAAKAHFVLHPDIQMTSFWESLILESAWKHYFRRPGDSRDIERRLKEAARSFPAAWELMPDKYAIDWLTLEFIWYQGRSGRHNRWIGTMQETYFGGRFGFPQQWHNDVQNAMDFKENSLGFTIPGVPSKSLVIWSDSEDPTLDSITYQRVGSRGDTTGDYWTNKRDYGGHGDGTVPTSSARDFKGAVNKIRIAGEHSRVANDPQTIIEIGKFLA
uniref:esterase/lipase family protein n=1 Tax=Marinobacterium profundum TaxID=1714300 RepID=UPI00082E363F|nr:alpha/beta hydrolase [Marinobacterium profundum]